MFFCNTCGRKTKYLYESHSLDKNRKRTGRKLMICLNCHQNYHKIRKDWEAWGKKGFQVKKKKYHLSIGMNRLGMPSPIKKNK